MTHQVQLSDAAYTRLKALKKEGESFSDVVLRSIARPTVLQAMATLPSLSDKEYRDRLAALRRMRDRDAERDERLDKLRQKRWP